MISPGPPRYIPFAYVVLSTLTQNVLDVQETEFSSLPPLMLTGAAQVVPLYPMMFPALSTAAQNVLLGHDTASTVLTGVESMTTGADQVLPLYVMACPPSSTATQNVEDAHDTATGFR
jgi:hypothetical protein